LLVFRGRLWHNRVRDISPAVWHHLFSNQGDLDMKRASGVLVVMLAMSLYGCDQAKPVPQGAAGPGPAAGPGNGPASKVNCFHPLSVHPKIELSNLEFSAGMGNKELLSVDWRVTSGKQEYPLTLVVVEADGNVHKIEAPGTIWQTGGTVGAEFSSIGFGSPSGPRLSSGCEVFLAIEEGEHLFKVSNSLTSGTPGQGLVSVTAPPAEMEQRAAAAAEARAIAEAPLPTDEDPFAQRPGEIPESFRNPEASRPQPSVPADDPASPFVPQQPEATPSTSPAAPSSDAADSPSPARSARERMARSRAGAGENGLVAVPEGLLIPKGTKLKQQAGTSWRDVTAVEDSRERNVVVHQDGSPANFRHPIPRVFLRLTPETLETLQSGKSPEDERQ
jgi:hypothetical protein